LTATQGCCRHYKPMIQCASVVNFGEQSRILFLLNHLRTRAVRVQALLSDTCINKELRCRWQTAWRICLNAMPWLTS